MREKGKAQGEGLGQKNNFGCHQYVAITRSYESGWDHLQAVQTEKRSGPSYILTFRVQRGMENPAKGAEKNQEENQKSTVSGGKCRKCSSRRERSSTLNATERSSQTEPENSPLDLAPWKSLVSLTEVVLAK